MLALFALACGPAGTGLPSATTKPPITSTDASSVGSTTTDTASTEESWPVVAPATVLYGPPGLHNRFAKQAWVIGDTDGDGAEDLLVTSNDEVTKLLDIDLDRTKVYPSDIEEFVRATLPYTDTASAIRPAGDTDRDGYGDVWLGNFLFRGPLDGEVTYDDADAEIVSPQGSAPFGGFDADGDGHLDMALGGSQQQFTIFYGPFEGEIPGHSAPGWDPSAVLQTETDNGCYYDDVKVLGAVNEPGQIVLVAGSYTFPMCPGRLWAYDVRGPRGRFLSFDDAFATFGDDDTQALPDADGDGLDDVLTVGQPLTGTVAGEYGRSVGPEGPEELLVFRQQFGNRALADATGDGLGDVLVRVPEPEGWWVVPGTTRGTDLAVEEHGVQLDLDYRVGGFLSGDLDGDGLAEIVYFTTKSGFYAEDAEKPGGEIRIFRGADIAAAFAALDTTTSEQP